LVQQNSPDCRLFHHDDPGDLLVAVSDAAEAGEDCVRWSGKLTTTVAEDASGYDYEKAATQEGSSDCRSGPVRYCRRRHCNYRQNGTRETQRHQCLATVQADSAIELHRRPH
jgi:hypothetical protein